MTQSASVVSTRESYHHGDLPHALKILTLEMLTEHGAEGFSLRQAAVTLGVAASALYRHFGDKSELLSAVADDGFLAMGALWLARVAQLNLPADADIGTRSLAYFASGADAHFQFGLDHPALFQLMFGPYGRASATRFMQGASLEPNPYAMLSQSLDGLCAAKVITPEARVNAEVTAFAAIHGLTCLTISGVFKDLDQAQKWQQLEQVKNNVLGGLLAWAQVQQMKAQTA
jgi:AcrR family transcriptional regulator